MQVSIFIVSAAVLMKCNLKLLKSIKPLKKLWDANIVQYNLDQVILFDFFIHLSLDFI